MCLIKGDFPRKHLFTSACFLFFVSFLFAQEGPIKIEQLYRPPVGLDR
jgi:hypothetical protein